MVMLPGSWPIFGRDELADDPPELEEPQPERITPAPRLAVPARNPRRSIDRMRNPPFGVQVREYTGTVKGMSRSRVMPLSLAVAALLAASACGSGSGAS